MICGKVASVEQFMMSNSKLWTSVAFTSVDMVATPLGLQPNEYIKVSWQDREYGKTDKLRVGCVQDKERIVFNLRWKCKQPVVDEPEGFPDGAAVAFPIVGDPPLVTMGAEGAPILALSWRSRNNEARSVAAQGIGTSEPGPDVGVMADATWNGGVWHLAISRVMNSSEEAVRLREGGNTRVGFVIWNGANQERGGIKSFSGNWIDLAIAP